MTDPNQNPTPAAPPAPAQSSLPGLAPAAPVVAIPPDWMARHEALAAQAKELQARLAAIETERASVSKSEAEAKDLAAQLQEKLKVSAAEREAALAAAKETRLVAALRDQARDLDVVDADAFVTLIRGSVAFAEDGSLVSASDPKIPLGVHAKAFVEARSYLQRPRVARGGGASPVSPAGVGGAPPVDLSTPEGMTAYARGFTLRNIPGRKTG